MPAALRLYRALLRTAPGSFRARFGAAMEQTFRDRHDALRGVAACRFATRAYLDVLATAAVLRAAALRDRLLWPDPIGNPSSHRRSDMWWQVLVSDVRYALRLFRRNPVFTGLAVVALGLGIGANTAIFTVVNGVLIRPLPYAQPDRLVMLWSTNSREHRDRDAVAPLDFMDFQKARSFASVQAAYSFVIGAAVTTPGGAEQIATTAVTPGLFETLGRAPVMGRIFNEHELQTGAVVSYDFWQKHLGGDPDVIGRVIDIAYQPRTITGVMPRDFVFPYGAMLGPSGFSRAQNVDAWLPLGFVPDNAFTRQTGTAPMSRAVRMLTVVARLAPGVSAAQAQSEMQGIARQLAAMDPNTNKNVGALVVPVHEQAVGETEPALLVLLGGVGLVLLMACVNLANMLLARSSARQKELSIRAALGAGRRRLVSQTLVESVLLGLGGGALALAVLGTVLRTILALAPPQIPRIAEVRPDLSVLLFTAALSLATGLVIGLLPAIASTRADVSRGLKQSSRGATAGRIQQRMRAALVIVEAALAVVLTIGAGLLIRSFVSLLDVNPGFQTEHLLTMQITVPPKYASADQRRVLYANLESRLNSIPGTTAVGGTTRLPLGSTNVSTKLVIEGHSVPPAQWPEAQFRRAIYDYFRAMGIPVLRGRAFTALDGPDAPPVCVINETAAKRIFAGEDPIGRHVKFGGTEGPWSTIVGVIGDIRHSALDAAPAPEVYVYYLQNPPVNPFLVVRTTQDPLSIVPAVREQLLAADKDISSNDIRPMTAVLSESIGERRFILLLATSFGLLALIMAGAGVYGVMALVVSERAQELAIRLALGAEPMRVLRLVLRQGLTLALAGVLLGVVGSAVITPSIASLLFGVRPADPLTFIGVPLIVMAVAAAACLIPARRIMRIDPVTALRVE